MVLKELGVVEILSTVLPKVMAPLAPLLLALRMVLAPNVTAPL